MNIKSGDLIKFCNDFNGNIIFDTISRVTKTEAFSTSKHYKLDLKSNKVKGTCVTYKKATNDELLFEIEKINSYPLITNVDIISAIWGITTIYKDDLSSDGSDLWYSVDNLISLYFKEHNIDYYKPFLIYGGGLWLVSFSKDFYEHRKDKVSDKFYEKYHNALIKN